MNLSDYQAECDAAYEESELLRSTVASYARDAAFYDEDVTKKMFDWVGKQIAGMDRVQKREFIQQVHNLYAENYAYYQSVKPGTFTQGQRAA